MRIATEIINKIKPNIINNTFNHLEFYQVNNNIFMEVDKELVFLKYYENVNKCKKVLNELIKLYKV